MLRHLKSVCNAEWQPVSRWALYAWAAFYALFVAYAASQHGEGLLIDNVNLVVHEGGHALFGWFGSFIGLCGGTALQLLVPLMLASYFFVQRQAPGLAFCIFFFFENRCRNVYGRRTIHELATGNDWRSRICNSRLERNSWDAGNPQLRHDDRVGHPPGWLDRHGADACVPGDLVVS